jgi:hypothetical protein
VIVLTLAQELFLTILVTHKNPQLCLDLDPEPTMEMAMTMPMPMPMALTLRVQVWARNLWLWRSLLVR